MTFPSIDHPLHFPLLVIDKQAYLSSPSFPLSMHKKKNGLEKVSRCLATHCLMTLIVTLFNNKKAIIQIV